ncbi:MAG: AAA family ATPase [Planctomycetaceae bacterium]
MYTTHWGLTDAPFEEHYDARLYYAAASHHGALLKLQYLVEASKSLGLLVGEHGLGKTMLTHVLAAELETLGVRFIRVTFPTLSPDEILRYIALRLQADIPNDSANVPADVVLARLEERIATLGQSNERVAVIIDEAHLLETPHLLRLQLFLNSTVGHGLSLILAGRSDLLPKVRRVPSLNDRVSVRAALEPLTETETELYIAQRLAACGREEIIFDRTAIRTLWDLSRGVPRRLNQLCDLAMLIGFADDQRQLTRVEVAAAAEELCTVSFD